MAKVLLIQEDYALVQHRSFAAKRRLLRYAE